MPPIFQHQRAAHTLLERDPCAGALRGVGQLPGKSRRQRRARLRSHPHLGIIVLLKGTDAAVLLGLLRWYTPLAVAGAIANYDIALLPRHAQQLHPELLCHDLVLC